MPSLHNHVAAPQPPSPPALCQEEEVGEESGSILWPQSLGVARLLPAGKREFGEISAADVPDNTVERQHQQGMCLPDENVLPPPPTTDLRGALAGPRQSVPCAGATEFMGRTPASSCVFPTWPDGISWHSGQASGDRGHTLGVHTHSDTVTYQNTHCPLANQQILRHPSIAQLGYSRAPLHSPSKRPYFWLPSCPIRAAITQSYIYQGETERFLHWHSAGCWDRTARWMNTLSAPGEFTAWL